MAGIETEIKQQEVERDSLQSTISGLQGALMFSTPESRIVLDKALRNAIARLCTVEAKLKDLALVREAEVREAASRTVSTADRETRLSARERETFDSFLKEDLFTKKDFGRLEQFYEKTWDRLSESGKNQMSHRVWEGVRHGEYTFDQLPPKVREKEMERAYKVLHSSSIDLKSATEVPEKDKADFIRAYESGNREEAAKVLDRESFKENMFKATQSAETKHAAADIGRQKESKQLAENVRSGSTEKTNPPAASPPASMGQVDFSSVNLSGMKLADASTQESSVNIPGALTTPVRTR